MKIKTTTTYISIDGKVFISESECREHERNLTAKIQSEFDRHFSVVHGISDDMANYVTGLCGYYTYSFVAFEGWEKVITDSEWNKNLTVNTDWYTDGVENGKRYLLFWADDMAYVVDPKILKERIMEDLEAMEA